MKRELVIGVDGGTESVRVGIFDLKGNEVGEGITPYKTYYPKPGWAEQDPNDWWASLAESIKKAMKDANASKDEIISIGLDTTCSSVVFCKKDGTPVRKAVIWMDIRSSEEAEKMAATGHEALKYNGFGNVSAEWMPSKVLWVKNHEPQNYHETEKIMDYVDWYTFMMTGRNTGSASTTTLRWYYDQDNGGVPEDFYKTIGLEDIFDKLPEEIKYLGEYIGGLTPYAAEHLGLAEGTPVGQGGVDCLNGMIGLGVTKPGKLALITGSSHCNLAFTDKSIHKEGIFGTYPGVVFPGMKLAEGGQASSGSVIKWFKTHFGIDIEEQAKQEGISVYDILNKEAAELPPGSEGLLVLEYWQGNRTPYVDANVRGFISGLTLKHTRAHIYRAIMEAIAYGTELNIKNFKENGIPVEELYLAGGATNSDLYLQIHADVSNLPINVPESNQVACLGSAIMAAVTAGAYANADEAVSHMVRYKKRIEPNPENHEIYKLYSEQYQKAYPQFKEWMHATSKLDGIAAEKVVKQSV
ncbi:MULTISPECIES: FGGY-family carbohydrate kinase [Oceanobacillus]|uniref:FGGY-family carbohydrate kinase n=1 Tax=Oceanobacillus TaxID=182709 RepID=UPI0030D78AE3